MNSEKIEIQKYKKNSQEYKECEESSHSSYPCEFFSIFGFGFFWKSFQHLLSVTNLLKQHPSHMMSQKILNLSRTIYA